MRTVVFFSGAKCVKCKEVKKFWNEIVEGNTFFDFVVEDTDKSLDMARTFHVNALPTFLVTEEGKEISRLSGEYVSKKVLQDFLNRNKQ